MRVLAFRKRLEENEQKKEHINTIGRCDMLLFR